MCARLFKFDQQHTRDLNLLWAIFWRTLQAFGHAVAAKLQA